MRRLDVRVTQIEECIQKSLFALSSLPRNPPLEKGEALLLQLVMADARRLGKERSRIEFALIFDHVEEDATGELSRRHWPDAGRAWRYILHCSETITTIPFSLESLDLEGEYSGRMNAVHLSPEGEAKVRPYLQGGTPAEHPFQVASIDDLLIAIRNHDRVKRLEPDRRTDVGEHDRRLADPWLSDALKRLYDHRCQICVHDFKPR